MSKRPGAPVHSSKISKKPKLNDHDETIWEDDLDDDCFDEIANQILEKESTVRQTQENSILPSYDSFKPNIPFASTQASPVPTHKFERPQEVLPGGGLKMKLACLEQKYEAKKGEVSILRAQMRKMNAEITEERSKKQREYLEITHSTEKEMKAIKGQLDFKDLEIANLKQKIMEISKANLTTFEVNSKEMVGNHLKSIISNKNVSKRTMEEEKEFSTTILLEPEFLKPSDELIEIFNTSKPEIHVVETRVGPSGRNTIPYLHNQMAQEELSIPPGPKLTMNLKNKEISLEDVYSDVFALFHHNIFVMNEEEKRPIINKLLGLSVELLKNFYVYLERLENIYRTEDIGPSSLKNSKDEVEQSSEIYSEIGVRAGRTVKIVAELLLYNDYLKNLLLTDCKNDEVYEDDSSLRHLKKKDFYFLLINDIVRIISGLRKENICSVFLNSVGTLLVTVSKENLYGHIFSAFNSLVGSMLFARPSGEVLLKILVVVKCCSTSRDFLDILCGKSECIKFKGNKMGKDFSEDSCKLTVFVFLLNNSLKNINEEKLPLDIAFNVLSFVDSIFTTNPSWVHNQQKKGCACLEQMYQLIIEVLYWIILKFKKQHNLHESRYIALFKCGIRIFELLFFNSYESVEKFIGSRYKELCYDFFELKEHLNLTEEAYNLDKICSFEDIPIVPSSSFEII